MVFTKIRKFDNFNNIRKFVNFSTCPPHPLRSFDKFWHSLLIGKRRYFRGSSLQKYQNFGMVTTILRVFSWLMVEIYIKTWEFRTPMKLLALKSHSNEFKMEAVNNLLQFYKNTRLSLPDNFDYFSQKFITKIRHSISYSN